MNINTDDLHIVFRPHWLTLAFWFFVSGGALLVFIMLSPLLDPPGWVRFYFVVMPTLALLVGLLLSFASVRVTPEGLASRHLRGWFVRWEDVEAWSQLGPGGSVYLRARDGRIRGFSSWCVYGVRCDRLATVLEQKLGPSATGEATVAPGPLKGLVG
jgi:hypothetical protein